MTRRWDVGRSGSGRDAPHREDVVSGGQQPPFTTDRSQPAPLKPSCLAGFFDLSEDRLDGDAPFGVDGPAPLRLYLSLPCLEAARGVPFWVLVVAPGPRQERAVRSALSGEGLAVATYRHAQVLGPTEAIWAPLEADLSRRVTLAWLAGWLRPEGSAARLAAARRR